MPREKVNLNRTAQRRIKKRTSGYIAHFVSRQSLPAVNKSDLGPVLNPSSALTNPAPEEQLCHRATEDDRTPEVYEYNHTKPNPIVVSEHSKVKHDIETELALWSVKNKVTLKATSALLKILKNHPGFENLPADGRSLLKTPRKIPIKTVAPGHYIHFGLRQCILRVLGSTCVDVVKLQINIDGIPVARSSAQQFWPILGYISSVPDSEVFTIGLYFGKSKPSLPSEYLESFVQDILEICSEGGILINNTRVKVYIDCFVCDAPARAYICGIKNHTGYFGCGKCIQEGSYVDNRVVFLETNSKLRTNVSFREKHQEEHHLGVTVLEKLQFNVVDQVPFEYMHLVCLGVTRKLLNLWMKGKIVQFRLPPSEVRKITFQLIQLKSHVPLEFSRKPRALQFIDTWKATEFRQFLLYTGPIVLKSVLPEPYYAHFMALHFAVTLLCTEKLYIKYNTYADSLLKYFVVNFPNLYGSEQMSYNVHGLLHLSRDSLNLGPLDRTSAFRFENHLGILKRTINSTNRPLEQVYNRICESYIVPKGIIKDKHKLKFPHSHGPNLDIDGEQYESLTMANYTIRARNGDNICQLKCGTVVKVLNIIKRKSEDIFIVGKYYISDKKLYSQPSDSKILDICKVSRLSELTYWNVELIKRKCVLFPIDHSSSACFPLIHTAV